MLKVNNLCLVIAPLGNEQPKQHAQAGESADNFQRFQLTARYLYEPTKPALPQPASSAPKTREWPQTKVPLHPTQPIQHWLAASKQSNRHSVTTSAKQIALNITARAHAAPATNDEVCNDKSITRFWALPFRSLTKAQEHRKHYRKFKLVQTKSSKQARCALGDAQTFNALELE